MTTVPSVGHLTPGVAADESVGARIRDVVGWDRRDRRRMVQLGLGLIWLIDAALQFQPFMFSKAFPAQIMAPTATGVPGVLGESITGMAHFVEPHIAAWNTLFALTQLAIALGIFWKRSVGWALAGSVLWAFGVWWFGEGFGGLFTSASPTMGFPGAVLLYALIAMLIFPGTRGPRGTRDEGPVRSVAQRSPIGMAAARVTWAMLWIGFAVLPAAALQPGRGFAERHGLRHGLWGARLDQQPRYPHVRHVRGPRGPNLSAVRGRLCGDRTVGLRAPGHLGNLGTCHARGRVDLAGRGLRRDLQRVRDRRG